MPKLKLSKSQKDALMDIRKGELRHSRSGTGYLVRLPNGMSLKMDSRTIHALRDKGLLNSIELTTLGKTIEL